MPVIDIHDTNKNKVGTLDLSPELWEAEENETLVWQVIKAYLANQRQGTSCTKNRRYVSGGGIKPFKQKGTGRARQGSSRSPLQRGGGVVFGPNPRDYSQKTNKKMRDGAIKSILSKKYKDGKIVVLNDINLEKYSTKSVVDFFKKFKLSSVLVVDKKSDDKLFKSVRNIPKCSYRDVMEVCAYQLLNHGTLVLTQNSLRSLEQRLVKA